VSRAEKGTFGPGKRLATRSGSSQGSSKIREVSSAFNSRSLAQKVSVHRALRGHCHIRTGGVWIEKERHSDWLYPYPYGNPHIQYSTGIRQDVGCPSDVLVSTAPVAPSVTVVPKQESSVIWRFVVTGTGTVVLDFSGSAICKKVSLCVPSVEDATQSKTESRAPPS
jgi:hypothetical protein